MFSGLERILDSRWILSSNLVLEKTVLLSCGIEIQFHTIHFGLDVGVQGVPSCIDSSCRCPSVAVSIFSHWFDDASLGERALTASFPLVNALESTLITSLRQEVLVASIQCRKLTTFTKHCVILRVSYKNLSFTIVMKVVVVQGGKNKQNCGITVEKNSETVSACSNCWGTKKNWTGTLSPRTWYWKE